MLTLTHLRHALVAVLLLCIQPAWAQTIASPSAPSQFSELSWQDFLKKYEEAGRPENVEIRRLQSEGEASTRYEIPASIQRLTVRDTALPKDATFVLAPTQKVAIANCTAQNGLTMRQLTDAPGRREAELSDVKTSGMIVIDLSGQFPRRPGERIVFSKATEDRVSLTNVVCETLDLTTPPREASLYKCTVDELITRSGIFRPGAFLSVQYSQLGTLEAGSFARVALLHSTLLGGLLAQARGADPTSSSNQKLAAESLDDLEIKDSRVDGNVTLRGLRSLGLVDFSGSTFSKLVRFENCTLGGVFDLRNATFTDRGRLDLMTSSVHPQSLNLQGLDIDAGRFLFDAKKFPLEALSLGDADKTAPEHSEADWRTSAAPLFDHLKARDRTGDADDLRLRSERFITSRFRHGFDALLRRAHDVFFGYGYQPWKFILLIMGGSTLVIARLLYTRHREAVILVNARRLGRNPEPYDRERRALGAGSLHLAFALLFSIRFDLAWITKNPSFTRFAFGCYALGLAEYGILLAGTRASFLESAKNLLGM